MRRDRQVAAGDQLQAGSRGQAVDLGAALERAASDPGVRAIVLAANGTVFSSGHDFSDMVDRDLDGMRRLLRVCADVMLGLARLPVPVVARVQGIATAAGCQLVASCDLAVAVDEASFATPGGKGGWFCHTPLVAVARAIGARRALELGLTGDSIDARTALAWGLVNRVVPAGTERDQAIALAQQVARKSAYTVKLGKEAFYRQAEMSPADAYRYAAEVMTENMMARDAEEGIGAFIEKRAPTWRDE